AGMLPITPMCPSRNSCRFSLRNGWVNSPPQVTKITVLHESTTDGFTIHGAFFHLRADDRGRPLHVEVQRFADPVDRLVKGPALLDRDGSPGGPHLVRRGTSHAVWPGRGVGFESRQPEVVIGPIVRVTAPRGGVFGSRCQRADACFDRPIVPRR